MLRQHAHIKSYYYHCLVHLYMGKTGAINYEYEHVYLCIVICLYIRRKINAYEIGKGRKNLHYESMITVAIYSITMNLLYFITFYGI